MAETAWAKALRQESKEHEEGAGSESRGRWRPRGGGSPAGGPPYSPLAPAWPSCGCLALLRAQPCCWLPPGPEPCLSSPTGCLPWSRGTAVLEGSVTTYPPRPAPRSVWGAAGGQARAAGQHGFCFEWIPVLGPHQWAEQPAGSCLLPEPAHLCHPGVPLVGQVSMQVLGMWRRPFVCPREPNW